MKIYLECAFLWNKFFKRQIQGGNGRQRGMGRKAVKKIKGLRVALLSSFYGGKI